MNSSISVILPVLNEAANVEAAIASLPTPVEVIVVDMKEVYLHCPKAYIRSKLWDPSAQMPRDELPTLGKMLLEQINEGRASKEEIEGLDAALETDSRENLY